MPTQLLLDTISIKQVPLAEKIHITAEAGYDGIELRGNDLAQWSQAGHSLEKLADLIAQDGLVAPTLCTEVDVYHWHHGRPMDDPDFVTALKQYFDQCQRLGCRMLFFPVMDTRGNLDETVRNFAWLCDQAASLDLTIALEFIGHVPKVDTIGTAWQVLQAANRRNSGIVVDIFHFYRGGSRLADLERIPPDRISVVHLDDAMPLPLNELIGAKHRLYPGDGVAPVREVVDSLRRNEYQGPYCVELFNEEYWASDALEVARRARDGALRFFPGESAQTNTCT